MLATKIKTAKISSKRQITLPKSFLDSLSLDAGQSIRIIINNGKIEISNPKQDLKAKLLKIVNSVSPKIKTAKGLDEIIEISKAEHYKNKKI